MKRDFMAELKAICRQSRERAPEEARPERLFNIHKRSLPVGIDKVVLFGVTREEAEMAAKVLKTRLYNDDARGFKTIIYYDLVPVGATPKERSIFFRNK